MSNGPAGMTGPKKGPTRKEIEKTYDQALDRFIKRNQDKKQQQSSVQSVIADMPEKFQKFIGRNLRDDGTMNSAAQAIFDFYDDGRTQYSRDINRISQKSPEFAAARARRFPIETFLERITPFAVGAATGIPLGLGAAYDEARKLGSATIGGLKDIAMNKGIIPRDDINPNTGTTSVKTDVINPAAASRVDPITVNSIFTGDTPMDPQPAVAPGTSFDPSAGRYSTGTGADDKVAQAYMDKAATFRSPRFTGRAPTDPGPVQRALPTDPITEGLRSLFTGATPMDPRPVRELFSSTFQQPFDPPMIPGGNPRGEVQSARLGPLLGSDPNIAYGQEMNMLDVLAERARRGFNEGGLASINNPQYNMLMNASNFEI